MARSFMDRMLSPLEFSEENTGKDKRKLGKKCLVQLLEDCRYKGERVGDLKGEKLDKALMTISEGVMDKAMVVSQSAFLVGGDLKEKIADVAIDVASEASDVLFGIQCPTFEEEGTHATVVKFPRNELKGENVLAMAHSLVRDVAGRIFDITDPEDLHELTYNMLILMAVVEAKIMARAHLKNIDRAGLLENPKVGELVDKSEDGERPMCKALKGRDFFKTICEGNGHREELDTALAKERKKIDEQLNESSFDIDW